MKMLESWLPWMIYDRKLIFRLHQVPHDAINQSGGSDKYRRNMYKPDFYPVQRCSCSLMTLWIANMRRTALVV